MSQRPTQTESYWVEDFELHQDDIEHLYSVLLERETPLSADQMALALFRYRVRREEEELSKLPASGDVYRPSHTYAVDDELTFSQFDGLHGKVTDVREGSNPDYGEFPVLTVKLEDDREYELASGLPEGHVLDEVEELAAEEVEETLLSPEDLFIEYGGSVADALEDRLVQHEDLVQLAGRWFPRSLLVDVNMGHLNLAEAVLDIAGGGPLTTSEILAQIGLLDDVNPRLSEFSMNYGLQEDERFDEVGPAGQVLWFLVRMEPEGVRTPPERLSYEPVAYDPSVLTPELAELELEIADELSDIVLPRGYFPEAVTVTLTYPHYRSGTLPLSAHLRRMFPTAYEAPRITCTLVDVRTGEEMPAWVVRTGGYVYGLEGWFEENGIPTGAYLTFERTDDAGRVNIRFAERNARKEWVRTALASGQDLQFENQQTTIGCEYDDLTVLDVADVEGVDAIWERIREQNTPLRKTILSVARALSAINPQGNVHAKTLYSAVNVIRRCPPGPIFSHLILMPELEHVGGPYWTLSEAVTGGSQPSAPRSERRD